LSYSQQAHEAFRYFKTPGLNWKRQGIELSNKENLVFVSFSEVNTFEFKEWWMLEKHHCFLVEVDEAHEAVEGFNYRSESLKRIPAILRTPGMKYLLKTGTMPLSLGKSFINNKFWSCWLSDVGEVHQNSELANIIVSKSGIQIPENLDFGILTGTSTPQSKATKVLEKTLKIWKENNAFQKRYGKSSEHQVIIMCTTREECQKLLRSIKSFNIFANNEVEACYKDTPDIQARFLAENSSIKVLVITAGLATGISPLRVNLVINWGFTYSLLLLIQLASP
jgi:hypothetical protein